LGSTYAYHSATSLLPPSRRSGLAWMATLSECLKATAKWVGERHGAGQLNRLSECAIVVGFSEYLGQLIGGLPMGQNEIGRPSEFGLSRAAADLSSNPAVARFVFGDWSCCRLELARLLVEGEQLDDALGDETLDAFRTEMRRFADELIIPNAHAWHLDDALIPDDIIEEMAALGVFSICIDPEYGGLGLGKLAMCVVTEELSRAWIAGHAI
jgi:(2S)-methylsuccinyl-CoA dehydrogenase